MTLRPTVGSLFAGIGGLDLGLERAGFEVRWQVENDPYCVRVLERHWPHVRRYGDIRAVDWSAVDPVDLVCGGFPCQPVSVAGRRRGLDDPRWLWPEFARCVRVLRPRFVLVENVPGLLVRGMGDVLGDLARCGYDAEWDSLPAAAVGAPHLRYRVFVVAYAQRPERRQSDPAGRAVVGDSCVQTRRQEVAGRFGVGGADVADAQGIARQVRQAEGKRPRRPAGGGNDVAVSAGAGWHGTRPIFAGAPGGTGPLGLPARSDWWAVEPDVDRVAHGVPARVDRLRALGNAVVPQVAEWIGRRILAGSRE
jgi:DNA (cytosine-5)-methyltransferase 1